MSDLALYTPVEAELVPAELVPLEVPSQNLVALLLNDKRSVHTRRAYARDLCDFFGVDDENELRARAETFCTLDVPQIRLAVLNYKTAMRERGLAEATINRRLAAIRSLLTFAHRLGRASCDGSNVAEGEKVTAYRDTRGVDVKVLKKLLAAPGKLFGEKASEEAAKEAPEENDGPHIYKDQHQDLNIPLLISTRARAKAERRLRDSALLHLLIFNALRRAEVVGLDRRDFDPSTRSLWITGKGRGSQKERVSLAPATCAALVEYADVFDDDSTVPLFRSLDPNPQHRGTRLTADGLYRLVGFYGRAVGLNRLTPHQLRHSAITAALDGGAGVREVQKLSRHKKLETLLIYDDNRADLQGEVSGLLEGIMTGNRTGKKKGPRRN